MYNRLLEIRLNSNLYNLYLEIFVGNFCCQNEFAREL